MSDDARRKLGWAGEDAAAAHLGRLGYDVVARNHRTRFGELDLVAHGHGTLVFCEIKSRRAGAAVSPWDALGPAKRKQVRAMGAAWLVEVTDRPHAAELRFDAIGVVFDGQGRLVRLDHLEAAF